MNKNTNKTITIKMSNGMEWLIPATWVAEKMADYYSKKNIDEEWEAEFEQALDDDAEMVDYLTNNFNWDDLRHIAVLVRCNDETDYQELWLEAECEVTSTTD